MSTLAFGSLTLRVFASHDDIAATVSTLFAPARVENWMHHATEFEKQRLSNLMESMMAWQKLVSPWLELRACACSHVSPMLHRVGKCRQTPAWPPSAHRLQFDSKKLGGRHLLNPVMPTVCVFLVACVWLGQE